MMSRQPANTAVASWRWWASSPQRGLSHSSKYPAAKAAAIFHGPKIKGRPSWRRKETTPARGKLRPSLVWGYQVPGLETAQSINAARPVPVPWYPYRAGFSLNLCLTWPDITVLEDCNFQF
jgi:hypothetical protein